jgi:hypothetical protein
MNSTWDIEENRGKEIFLNGGSIKDILDIKNDFVKDARMSGYFKAQKSFQSRNFELEIEEQRVHFEGVESAAN